MKKKTEDEHCGLQSKDKESGISVFCLSICVSKTLQMHLNVTDSLLRLISDAVKFPFCSN